MSTENIVRKHAILADDARPLTRAVFDAIDADARFVLIGEASHGTHDFYQHRAEVTRRLIEERGFNAGGASPDSIRPHACRLAQQPSGNFHLPLYLCPSIQWWPRRTSPTPSG